MTGCRPLILICCCLFLLLGVRATIASELQPLWVETFDEEFINWAEAHVDTFPFPGPQLYRQIYCHMTIGCPGPPGDCDPWDRYATLLLRHHDTDSTHVDYEIMRFVTPYDITYGDPNKTCSWYVDVTDYQFLLHDDVTLVLFIDSWIGGIEGWLVTVDFEMIAGVPSREPYAIENLWQFSWINYGDPDNPVEDHMVPMDVETPPEAIGAKVRTYSTGHGFLNTHNAAEFSQKWQQLHVDADSTRHVLWRTDCAVNPCSPQQGTWQYNRAGWCPGDKADAWEIDVSDLVTPGAPSTYHFKLQPYENVCRPNNPDCVDTPSCECAGHAYYRFRSQVIFYRTPITTAVESQPAAPARLRLIGSYPNPANGRARVEYELAEPGELLISVYDVEGGLVRSLRENHRSPGTYSWTWDGQDGGGQPVSAGVYFYEVRYGEERISAKMLMLH